MKSVHVRLDADAHEALKVVACARGMDIGKCARVILTEALMGKIHTLQKALDGYHKPEKAR